MSEILNEWVSKWVSEWASESEWVKEIDREEYTTILMLDSLICCGLFKRCYCWCIIEVYLRKLLYSPEVEDPGTMTTYRSIPQSDLRNNITEGNDSYKLTQSAMPLMWCQVWLTCSIA